jgi:hypothetical protein
VRATVARAKKASKEMFVPLAHPPGQAQFDFGEATVKSQACAARPPWR